MKLPRRWAVKKKQKREEEAETQQWRQWLGRRNAKFTWEVRGGSRQQSRKNEEDVETQEEAEE